MSAPAVSGPGLERRVIADDPVRRTLPERQRLEVLRRDAGQRQPAGPLEAEAGVEGRFAEKNAALGADVPQPLQRGGHQARTDALAPGGRRHRNGTEAEPTRRSVADLDGGDRDVADDPAVALGDQRDRERPRVVTFANDE